MKTILSLSKTHSAPLALVPLLGITFDVTIRLKNVQDESLKQVDPSVKV